MGGNLLNRHWLPKKFLLDKINKIYETKFRSHFVIGIQFRTYYLNVKKDVDVFLKCALQIEENYMKNNQNKTMPVKWYISSDSNQLIKDLLKNYEQKIILGEGLIAHIASDKHGYDRAILDIELLSKTNELIITGGSTFGFIATMKQLRLSYFVNGKGSMNQCRRMLFSDTGTTGNNTSEGAAVF